MSRWLPDSLMVVGCALVVAGVFLVHPPTALVVAGLLLFLSHCSGGRMGRLASGVLNVVRGIRSGGGWFGPYGSGDKALLALFDAGPAAAGVPVNERSAMRFAPFSSAVTLLSNLLAIMPLHLYNRVGEGRERDRAHPLDRLVSIAPNAEMSAFVWRRQMMYDVLTAGVAYAEIQRNQGGRPVALWHADPARVLPSRDDTGSLFYRISNGRGGETRLWAENLLVILGPGSPDGVTPSSPIERLREAIGLGLATERFGASFFGNGAWPGIVAQHPGKLSAEAHKRLKASLNDSLQGPNRAHSLIVTEEGIKIEKAGIPPEDSQFLQTREHQINEVARVFNIPPTLIGGNLEGGLTYANSLNEAQRLVDHCLLPLGSLWEQESNRKLLTAAEQETRYFAMTFEGLLRGDLVTRYGAYRTGIEAGFLLPNEARAREDLPELVEASSRSAPRTIPEGADYAVIADALGRVLARWTEKFRGLPSAAAVRETLADFACDKDLERSVAWLGPAFTLVPGADPRTVLTTLRTDCRREIQQLLETVPGAQVQSIVHRHTEAKWPQKAGALAAQLVGAQGRIHRG